MNRADRRSSPWRWYEYEVGLFGEIVRACARALIAFLIGLAGTFVLILAAGILAEENLLGDPGLGNAVDHLGRMGLGLLMVFALVTWSAFAVASCLREVTTSRALVRAAARGASRRDVPAPDQVESATRAPALQLSLFGWANAALAGLFGVVGLGIALFDADSEALTISALALGYTLVMTLIGFAGPKWLTPVHERRQARIAEHWSADDESRAWRAADSARRARRNGAKRAPSRSLLAERCIYGSSVLALVGFIVFAAALSMRCAAIPGRAGQECNETTYSSFIESILAFGFWIFAVLFPLAVLLALTGVLLDWRQRRRERATLRAALADSRSPRPDEHLLAYHARRRMHPLALVSAALSGAGLVLSTSAYLVGEGEGLGSEDVFAVYRTESLLAMAVSTGLFVAALLGSGIANVRGRELRNELMRRWPTAPSWSANSEGRVLRAKRGPALRGSRYEKVGRSASSG